MVFAKAFDSMTGWPSLPSSYHPLKWRFTTGGKCTLDYRYVFSSGDKAEQSKAISSVMLNAVTSNVHGIEGKVDISGIQSENLLNVDGLNLTVTFNLAGVKTFPSKEAVLSECVKESVLVHADNVLFSPASSSFDRYADYAARGKAFDELFCDL